MSFILHSRLYIYDAIGGGKREKERERGLVSLSIPLSGKIKAHVYIIPLDSYAPASFAERGKALVGSIGGAGSTDHALSPSPRNNRTQSGGKSDVLLPFVPFAEARTAVGMTLESPLISFSSASYFDFYVTRTWR